MCAQRVQMTEYSVQEVAKIMANKAELYEAAVRNGFFLPKFKSSIITEDYMNMVISGQILCPKYLDIRLKPCPIPPDKDTLIKMCQSAAGQKNLGIDEAHQPDKNWLLAVLSTLNPDASIFKKSYLPPKRNQKIEVNAKVQLPADFLDGLPESRKRRKKRGLGMLRAGREEAKTEKIKKLQETYKKQLVAVENRSKQLGHASKNKQLQMMQRRYSKPGPNPASQSAANHNQSQSLPGTPPRNSNVNISQQNPLTSSLIMSSSSSSNPFIQASQQQQQNQANGLQPPKSPRLNKSGNARNQQANSDNQPQYTGKAGGQFTGVNLNADANMKNQN